MLPVIPVLSLIAAVILVVSLIGAGWVVLRGSAVKQSAEGWRDEADAQKARADRLQSQVEELITQVRTLSDRISVLESEKTRLERMVTAQAEIQALSAKIDHQHTETMAALLTVSAGVHGSP